MKPFENLRVHVVETASLLKPTWPEAMRWAGYIGFFCFVILPALLLAKIALKILLILISW